MNSRALTSCPRCNLCAAPGECDCIPSPAEACSEIGSEPRERMGQLKGWERVLLGNALLPAAATAALSLIALAVTLALTK